ncbi:hypothetical protein LTSEMIN_0819 [Salmonella enterica subsp. enterica serovar Minnesota str. A4-603]|nr:hypothetical protein LTSEMIN_0819 [Salmonella enterica subsp. enterica serovar Minnesota str. A4-603]
MQLPPLFQYVATELCENGLRAAGRFVLSEFGLRAVLFCLNFEHVVQYSDKN